MKQESGRSMIEMLGVLAIMGAITAAAALAISSAMRMQKQSRVSDDVVMMTTGVRQLLGEYDDFSNIDNSSIFTAIGVKNKNPYGGNYSLSVNPANTRQFIVSIDGLSQDDCKTLVTKAWTDSVAGAKSDCKKSGNNNVVEIIYGE